VQKMKMGRSDEELMASCRDGDEGAFEILYRRYEKPIFSFIYRLVMSAADAEDLCQETFFRVVRAKKKYQASGRFKTWLFQIALNLCHDRLRRMKFRSHLSLDAPLPSGDCRDGGLQQSVADPSSGPMKCAETDEMKALVQQAFATLPREQRTVVVLKEYHALKFSEIAEIMNCPIGTVKSLNYRGRQRLMASLSKYMH
jgi:RNA polymerase sigma-70 factor (ECF subfamily)